MRSAGHLRVVGQQELQCVDDGWQLLKSSKMCYKHVDELKTWQLAKEYCERFGGHLACASNVEINNFLTTLFPKSRKHGWVDNNVYLGAEKVPNLTFVLKYQQRTDHFLAEIRTVDLD